MIKPGVESLRDNTVRELFCLRLLGEDASCMFTDVRRKSFLESIERATDVTVELQENPESVYLILSRGDALLEG